MDDATLQTRALMVSLSSGMSTGKQAKDAALTLKSVLPGLLGGVAGWPLPSAL